MPEEKSKKFEVLMSEKYARGLWQLLHNIFEVEMPKPDSDVYGRILPRDASTELWSIYVKLATYFDKNQVYFVDLES